MFIKEQTYWIKHTTFTRLFVQDILHYHEDRTHISIKSFDIQLSSVQKNKKNKIVYAILSIFISGELIYTPAGKGAIKITHCTICYHTIHIIAIVLINEFNFLLLPHPSTPSLEFACTYPYFYPNPSLSPKPPYQSSLRPNYRILQNGVSNVFPYAT